MVSGNRHFKAGVLTMEGIATRWIGIIPYSYLGAHMDMERSFGELRDPRNPIHTNDVRILHTSSLAE